MLQLRAPLFESLQVTFAILQSTQLVLLQQHKVEIENLVSRIGVGIGIGHENDGNNDFMFMDENTFVKAGEWWISFDSIRGPHITDQGSWARDLFAEFSADDQDATLRNIAAFALNLVDGLNQIQADRDSNNGASAESF